MRFSFKRWIGLRWIFFLAAAAAVSAAQEEKQLHLGFFPPKNLFFGPRVHPAFIKAGKVPGGSLATGDLNGDGKDDLIMGEESSETLVEGGSTVGVVLISLGWIPERPVVLDHRPQETDPRSALLYAGSVAEDARGLALGHVVRTGDLNGDGRDDLAIAQPNVNPSASKSVPRVHLLWGRDSFPNRLNLQTEPYPSGQPSDVVIYGPSESGFGASLVVSDLSGDGMADILIGAPFRGEQNAGAIYVLWGRKEWPKVIDLNREAPDGAVTFPHGGAMFGWSMAADDLNGDGSWEPVVSAPGAAVEGRQGVGSVLVLDCEEKASGRLGLSAVAQMDGLTTTRFLGSSVALGRSSGKPFLAVGASGGTDLDDSSEVHVVPVQDGFKLPRSLSENWLDGSFSLFHDKGRMGNVLATGDLDGDGNDELAVGMQDHMVPAFDPNVGRPECGRVLVLSPNDVVSRRSDLRVALPRAGVYLDLFGGVVGEHFGSGALIEDVDGDGRGDLIVKSRGVWESAQSMRPSTLILLEPKPRSGYLPAIPPRPDPASVLLLVNRNSSDSVRIGNRYSELRPEAKRMDLQVALPQDDRGAEDEITAEQYWSEIAGPVCERLDSEDWWGEVQYVVTTKGFPLRLKNQSAVDGQLCLLTRDWQDGKRQKRNLGAPVSNPYKFMHNPLAGKDRTGPPHIFLVTRLTAFTAEEAIEALNRAQFPQDAFTCPVVVDNDLRACSSRNTNPMFLRSVRDRLEAMGARAVYEETPRWIEDCKEEVIGYVSWGLNSSNQRGKGPLYVSKALDFDYAPGAAFLTIESFNAWSFTEFRRETAPFRQGLLGDFLREGGTCGVGNVAEPTLAKTARPDIFFVRLALGFCLADAAYASMGWVGWRQVVVGDPLMQWPTSRTVF